MSPTPPLALGENLGARVTPEGIHFAVFSKHATQVTVCLYCAEGLNEQSRHDLEPGEDHIWRGFVPGANDGQLYGLRTDGPYEPHAGHRFNYHKLLIDPWAKELFGEYIHHPAVFAYDVSSPELDLSFDQRDSAPYVPKCVATAEPSSATTNKPNHPGSDYVIYEAHCKGFSQRHPDIPSAERGKFSALAHPATTTYLRELGVTALELLPVQTFISEPHLYKKNLSNYWGYNPINYFSAQQSYGNHSEFRAAVDSLHEAGIEVILDVVYNHTAEGDELGPTLSYRGLDNHSYYRLAEDPRFYLNDAGTGNTLNMAEPEVLKLSIESLNWWVQYMGIDGFRFDLAPTLLRSPLNSSQTSRFLEAIANDPRFDQVKLIAEPWDIGPDGYRLGHFPNRWMEWNDRFRDDVRSFWRNDEHTLSKLPARLLGSAAEFDHGQRSAFSSVNFLAAHDGFTLHDTVSYTHKHNDANAEQNRDGHNHNISDNMGVEGPSADPVIVQHRRQRKKNMLATLFVSQGIPMLLAGDEFGQSQLGNNNGYCQDNETTWLNWSEIDAELLQATKRLIQLRQRFGQFRQSQFLHGRELLSGAREVVWLAESGAEMTAIEWESAHNNCFAMVLNGEPDQGAVMVVFNRGAERDFTVLQDNSWRLEFCTNDVAKVAPTIAADSVSIYSLSTQYFSAIEVQKRTQQRAEQLGFLPSFRDLQGNNQAAETTTLQALIKAVGDSGAVRDENAGNPLAAEQQPLAKVFGSQYLSQLGGVWGITCGLYSLHSERSWGIGDFSDLASFCELAAQLGADFVGLNPLHALFPSNPELHSPYSPSSREFLNVMLIAPDLMPGYQPQGQVQNNAREAANDISQAIDYAKVYQLKHATFARAFENFKSEQQYAQQRRAFAQFKSARGEALAQHALFECLFEDLPEAQQNYSGWMNFHEDFQSPTTEQSKAYAQQHAARLEFHQYLQWVASEQLEQAQACAKAAGMHVGLYLDYAVGVTPGGSDAWRHQGAFADQVGLGAPPDLACPEGQNWGLLAFNPHAMQSEDFATFRSSLAANMHYAGALRIDHVLGLERSFWISATGQGAYMRYPFAKLIQVLAELSHEHQCLVVGEDLGTVPDGFRDKLAQAEMIGCSVYIAERQSNGALLDREQIRRLSLTSFTNHDFPTIQGFWLANDLIRRGAAEHELQQREQEKQALAELLGWNLVPETLSAAQMADVHGWLAQCPSLAFAVQLSDLTLDARQQNVPGTTHEYPNWRIRANVSVEDLSSAKHAVLISKTINANRSPHKRI